MENAIFEKLKGQVKNLKVLSEELQVQMALGKAEAKDLVDREKKELTNFFNKQKKQIERFESSAMENRRAFLSAVEDLESSLHVDIPEDKTEYDLYKDRILKNIYKLEEVTREHFPQVEDEMKESLEAFKAKMDAFRVNLALHDKDDPEKVRQVKREFSEKVAEIRTTLAKKEEAQTKLENFFEDLSESFNYLKKAISDLSN
ncbi:MAG: hypothetical protein HKO89_07450 [Saprospiraceae bacterium]|nr:hypothetical protein [Saprospiraceae bacterium]